MKLAINVNGIWKYIYEGEMGENMSAASILIIDDDPDSVKATQAILEDRKYKVRSACDAVEGLARLEEEGADVIILDVMMRECAEGFVFARRIKKENRFSKIPILMLTGMQDATGFYFPVAPIHRKFLPVDEYLEKPVEPEVLLETIERQLARRFAD